MGTITKERGGNFFIILSYSSIFTCVTSKGQEGIRGPGGGGLVRVSPAKAIVRNSVGAGPRVEGVLGGFEGDRN